MKMKIFLLLILLFFKANSFASGVNILEDSLIYYEFDIRSKTEWPICMRGMTKKLNCNLLNFCNSTDFLSSFYKQAYYTINPFIYDSMIKEISATHNGSCFLPQIRKGQMNIISENCNEKSFRLQSGEIVYMRTAKIKGKFLICNKNKVSVPTVSDELSIYDVSEISDICIAIDIYSCKGTIP